MNNTSLIDKMKTASKAEKVLIMLESRGVTLTDEEREAFFFCFGQRGAYAGYLKKSAPNASKYPLANVIYNAIQPNGYKVQVFNLMVHAGKYSETYKKLSEFKYPDWLDKDKETLQSWGAW